LIGFVGYCTQIDRAVQHISNQLSNLMPNQTSKHSRSTNWNHGNGNTNRM